MHTGISCIAPQFQIAQISEVVDENLYSLILNLKIQSICNGSVMQIF